MSAAFLCRKCAPAYSSALMPGGLASRTWRGSWRMRSKSKPASTTHGHVLVEVKGKPGGLCYVLASPTNVQGMLTSGSTGWECAA